MTLITSLLQKRVDLWVSKRFPKNESLTIRHTNLFIFATRFGLWLCATIFLLFVLGTNYQNNPILLISFFLISLGIFSVHICFNNLNGLTIQLLSVKSGYTNEPIILVFKIAGLAESQKAQQLQAKVGGELYFLSPVTDSPVIGNHKQFTLTLPSTHRGKFEVPRITFTSEYPFGLVKAWTYFTTSQSFYVYPVPISSPWQLMNEEVSQLGEQHHELSQPQSGDATFEGLKSYIPGSSMAQVAWKQFAKQPENELLLKEFNETAHVPVLLTLDSVPATDIETKLSQLVAACHELEQDNTPFGLTLSMSSATNVTEIKIDTGAEHLSKCLKAISVFIQPHHEYEAIGND